MMRHAVAKMRLVADAVADLDRRTFIGELPPEPDAERFGRKDPPVMVPPTEFDATITEQHPDERIAWKSDAGLAVLVGCTLLAAAALLGYTWWSWNSSAPRRAEDMADDYVLTHGGFRANSVVFERSRRRSHGQRNGGASGPCRWVGSNGGKGCGHRAVPRRF